MFIRILYIGSVILLVLANGFFVASEFSLVAVRRSRIEILAESGNRRAVTLLGLIDNLNAYISATQLGITMASLALGWIGEPTIASLLEAPLQGYVPDAVRNTIAFIIAFSTITFLHIVLGELAPKTLALERTERIALAIALPMRVFYKMFRWPVRLLDWSGTRAVRLFGLHPSGEHTTEYTADELRYLIDVSQKSGSIEADEQKLLQGVFEFSDTEVREVMVPRNAVDALPVTADFAATRNAFRSLGYSRIPVYREHLDNIVGVLYRRDLEPFLEQANTDSFDIATLIHPPRFIPATAQLSTALRQMQVSRTHLAVVVDEYGGVAGIVTLEDLLEEIVGEIVDEFDDAAMSRIVESNGSYLVDGMMSIREINNYLNLHLPEEGPYTTIAGFMLAQAGRMMNAGEAIEHVEGRFVVESLDRRRIHRISFTPASTP